MEYGYEGPKRDSTSQQEQDVGELGASQLIATLVTPDGQPIQVVASKGLVTYKAAHDFMRQRTQKIIAGKAPMMLWLLEHDAVITAGTSTHTSDRQACPYPIVDTGRGGQLTYHGPGQRVLYLMLDLSCFRKDIKWYIHTLEALVINAVKAFGVTCERRTGRVGLWVPDAQKTALGRPRDLKIAAIGIRVSKWVTYHGLAVNVAPDLKVYTQFTPCGITEHGVTSLEEMLAGAPSMASVDLALVGAFTHTFGCRKARPSFPQRA